MSQKPYYLLCIPIMVNYTRFLYPQYGNYIYNYIPFKRALLREPRIFLGNSSPQRQPRNRKPRARRLAARASRKEPWRELRSSSWGTAARTATSAQKDRMYVCMLCMYGDLYMCIYIYRERESCAYGYIYICIY